MANTSQFQETIPSGLTTGSLIFSRSRRQARSDRRKESSCEYVMCDQEGVRYDISSGLNVKHKDLDFWANRDIDDRHILNHNCLIARLVLPKKSVIEASLSILRSLACPKRKRMHETEHSLESKVSSCPVCMQVSATCESELYTPVQESNVGKACRVGCCGGGGRAPWQCT